MRPESRVRCILRVLEISKNVDYFRPRVDCPRKVVSNRINHRGIPAKMRSSWYWAPQGRNSTLTIAVTRSVPAQKIMGAFPRKCVLCGTEHLGGAIQRGRSPRVKRCPSASITRFIAAKNYSSWHWAPRPRKPSLSTSIVDRPNKEVADRINHSSASNRVAYYRYKGQPSPQPQGQHEFRPRCLLTQARGAKSATSHDW